MILVEGSGRTDQCSACVAKGVREPAHQIKPPILSFTIQSGVDDSHIDDGILMPGFIAAELCDEHARDFINAVSFVYCSVTSISLSKLVGLKERKKPKRKSKANDKGD